MVLYKLENKTTNFTFLLNRLFLLGHEYEKKIVIRPRILLKTKKLFKKNKHLQQVNFILERLKQINYLYYRLL